MYRITKTASRSTGSFTMIYDAWNSPSKWMVIREIDIKKNTHQWISVQRLQIYFAVLCKGLVLMMFYLSYVNLVQGCKGSVPCSYRCKGVYWIWISVRLGCTEFVSNSVLMIFVTNSKQPRFVIFFLMMVHKKNSYFFHKIIIHLWEYLITNNNKLLRCSCHGPRGTEKDTIVLVQFQQS